MSDFTENTETPTEPLPFPTSFGRGVLMDLANSFELRLTEHQQEVIASAAAELYRTAEAFSIGNEAAELATKLARPLTDDEHQKAHALLVGFAN